MLEAEAPVQKKKKFKKIQKLERGERNFINRNVKLDFFFVEPII